MRTQEEILARIEEVASRDWLGTQRESLIGVLTFANAKQFLKPEVTNDQWELNNDDAVRKEAIEYMEFAWDKANNCRGISAGRSLDHYTAWLWLLGDDDLWPTLEDYEHYGKPQLRKICEYFGLDADQWDDDIRVNSEAELGTA